MTNQEHQELRRRRVLMIGPLPRAGTPIGGTQVSFGQCVARLEAGSAFDVEVVDTSRVIHDGSRAKKWARDLRTLTSVLSGVGRKARACDVAVLNMSSGALCKAGPLIAELGKALDLPLVVRAFGGCLDATYDALPAWRRHWIDETLFQSPLVLLQTKHLCERFADVPGVRWFPTTRVAPTAIRPVSERCRKFLFLSQVRAEKGVLDAVAAARELPEGCSLTIRGPLMPGFDANSLEGQKNVRYGGPVAPEEVADVIAAHDVLVFPTWYEGEGIPGVVVEALQAGRAVIASAWRSLPDVVEDERSGLLVPPRDVEALGQAMTRLALLPNLHARLARGARTRGLQFDAAGWQARLESWLRQVADDQTPSTNAAPIVADGSEQPDSRHAATAASTGGAADTVIRPRATVPDDLPLEETLS